MNELRIQGIVVGVIIYEWARRILFDQTKSGTGIRKKETLQYGWLVDLV